MKTYEIYEKYNRQNKMTVSGLNFADACKKVNIRPRKYVIVSWAWAD